jgi:hypothetical protein
MQKQSHHSHQTKVWSCNQSTKHQRSRHFRRLKTSSRGLLMRRLRNSRYFRRLTRWYWRLQSSLADDIASPSFDEISSSSSFIEESSSSTQMDGISSPPVAETISKLLSSAPLNPPLLTADNLATHTKATQSDVASNTFTGQDSTFGGGFSEPASVMTKSVASSIYAGEVEYGRRYPSFLDATYHIPIDEEQQHIENMMDHAWRELSPMRHRLFLSPIEAEKMG